MLLKLIFTVNVYCLLVNTTFAGLKEKLCKVPNGDAGVCIQISKCRPLWDLYKQKRLTADEHLYLRQSFCGSNQSSKIKMCCPDKSEWSNFTANPVVYPTSLNAPSYTKEPVPVEEIFAPKPMMYFEEPVDQQFHQPCGKAAYQYRTEETNTHLDDYPWLVLLEYGGDSLDCGGSLISRRFVLTAAHCIDYRLPLFARLGEYDLTTGPIDVLAVEGGLDTTEMIVIPVETGTPHPKFSRALYHDDIGLVKLSRNAPFTDFIRHICLPPRDYIPELSSDTRFVVAKWGENVRTKSLNTVKQQLTLPYVPLDECRKFESKTLYDTQICAGGEAGVDICRGDSGGPLMFMSSDTFSALGVISFGATVCGTKDQPGVFTHVYKYRDWISNMTGIL